MRLQSPRARAPIVLRLFSAKTLVPALICIWCLYFVLQGKSSSLRTAEMPKFDPLSIYMQSKLGNLGVSNHVLSNHMVMVPGHAVMRISELAAAETSDSAWYLLPYQLNQGFPTIISSHIKMGVERATQDADGVLIFSGGQTRADVGPFSEAASYYYLASSMGWLDDLRNRVYLEEYARDSFENLLFSICRYHEVHSTYPSKVSVVGFNFKGRRFIDLHRVALGFTEQNFEYFGVDPPPQFELTRAIQGEEEAYREFQRDMYGCRDKVLTEKKALRDPFHRTLPYRQSCPELQPLFDWCGPGLYDVATLPWNNAS